MTNDDRSNEDRTGDGRAPSWGEAPQHGSADRAGDLPRHGERDDAPRYGERSDERADTPRYGERSDAPRWGEQHGDRDGRPADSPTWGEQHGLHQPYAAAAAPTSANAPAWQSYDEPKRKKKTVGVVAFVLALVAVVLAVVAGTVFGSAFGANSAIRDAILNGSAATQSGQEDLQRQLMNDPTILTSSGGAGIAILIGTVLGLWALVQGIIAIVTKRGRAFGVVAVILAVLGPVVLYIVFAVALGSQLT